MDEIINALYDRINRLEAKVDVLISTVPNKAWSDLGIANIIATASDTQDALCETSIDVDEHITVIEDALCELSKEV